MVNKAYEQWVVDNNNDVTVTLDPVVDQALEEEAIARQFNSRVQKTRKEIGVHVDDLMEVFVDIQNSGAKIKSALEKNWDQISKKMNCPMYKLSDRPE